VTVVAFDIQLAAAASPTSDAMREHARVHGVTLAASHAALAAGADLIVSAVTASQAVPVAQACAPSIRADAWYLDFNSASPGARARRAGD
jgi:3-hydroxyisobutyrate dehydrogenase-like beta-hydroxyacid dehydrogenase